METVKNLKNSVAFQSRRKRPRTPTPGNYLGVKNTRDTSEFFFFFCVF